MYMRPGQRVPELFFFLNYFYIFISFDKVCIQRSLSEHFWVEKTSVPMYEDINCIFSMDLFSF